MKSLHYGRQYIDDGDIAAVAAVLRGDWLTQGPAVDEFEQKFADYVGAAHAVAFANGTAAIHGAYYAAGVESGDEVVTSAMTFAATGNAALYLGGVPRFGDIDPDTLCLDPLEARKKISSRTKVIAPVSYAGFPVDLAPFMELADSCGAVVVEDACHALGGTRNGVRVGKEAHLTAFSFHPVKHITTAEGGMVTTDSDEFARRMRLFRTHGIEKAPDRMKDAPDGPWATEMQVLGFNYRLSELHAALGSSQMRKLDRFVARRREIASLYDRAFDGTPAILTPPRCEGHAYHLYPLRFRAEDRARAFAELGKRGVHGMVHYLPVPLHPYYRDRFGYKRGDFPHAEELYAREVSMPLFYGLSDEDVASVVDAVLAVIS